ncbi:hypothetical protein OESDEN_21373 [Oesophagostomum dentatum]|uniref:Uncharacterized protein n=1 Tax=Oesophagostomum dentatum TaxID=61180 RepID=A0A0B1S545_OESDE|nr:hypothetical protein OESDEN_21373 [Oesophagostomum dentatum]
MNVENSVLAITTPATFASVISPAGRTVQHPEGAAKQFRREWFQGDDVVRRKNLPIEYNL